MVMFNNFHLPDYYGKIIATLILVVIIKYFNSLLNILFVIFIILMWGVDTTQLFGFVGAAITFIGVAFFAQWSVLSNFTAGVIMFFCISL